MKTRKGKLFTLLLVLTVIFTFTGIAYGTSDSGKDLEDQLAQSEDVIESTVEDEQEVDVEKSDVDPVEGEDVVEQDEEAPDEATDEPEVDLAVPRVVTDGVVVFEVDNAEQADVFYGDTVAPASLTVDPEDITGAAPFVFSVIPAEGYEIDEVSFVSKFNERAKPFVPEENGAVEGDDVEGVPVEELSEALAAALKDTTEKSGVLEADPNLSEDGGSIYSIDDMAIFAGRDVTISIKTKEVQYDAWYKVVDALAAGHNVKLSQDIVIGSQASNPDLNPTQQQNDKSQAVVNPNKDDSTKIVTLDLNGFTITAPGEGMNNGARSIIAVQDKAKFEIKDALTAVPSVITRKSSGLTLNGENGANGDLVGKTGYFDGDDFIYYVTTSSPSGNGATKETAHEMALITPGADKKVGRIIASSSIENLVEVTSGSDLKISGGVYTNVKGRALKNDGGSLDMQGGIIMKCSPDNLSGAGIYANGGTTNISGNSAIIGNSVNGPGENWNGGGVSVNGGVLNVSGNALISGNKANGDYNADGTGLNYKPEATGGGIYGKNAAINLSGDCRIAGNEAKYYGGGINAENSVITTSDNATITNNKTTYCYQGDENTSWKYKTLGGGGVHATSGGTLSINGGRITANFSADGGGGMLVPDTQTTFSMGAVGPDSPIVASNYAGKSEGGGMYLRPAKGSKIASGYITNNATATPFDFGGGGIYVANEAEGVEVVHPVVTKNTAEAYGGGAANCQNGVTISDKAAIFGNTAKGESLSNTSVEVDHWMKDMLGLKGSDAMDFVGGKKSDIYANMLGGGYYNWTGYMSYQPSISVDIDQQGWGKTSITLNGKVLIQNAKGGLTKQPSGYYQVTIPADMITEQDAEAFNDVLNKSIVRVNRVGLVNETFGFASNYTGKKDDKESEFGDESYALISDSGSDFWYFAFSIAENQWDGYTKDIWSKHPTNRVDANDTEWADRDRLYIPVIADDNEVETWISTTEGISPYKTLTAAKTTTAKSEFGYEEVTWPIASVKFPENQNALARANRFMCLTAHPNPTAEAAAISAGSLFITGNYSTTNGGGIANNGTITIGENPKNPPTDTDKKEYKNGKLVLKKTFDGEGFDPAMNGAAVATFRISQYASYEDTLGGNPMKEDVVTLAFTKGGTLEYEWPEEVYKGNYFVVEELDIEGDNAIFKSVEPLISNKQTLPVEYKTEVTEDEDGNTVTTYTASVEFSFTNVFNPESYMTSVINKYVKGADGKFTFEQKFTPEKAGDQSESN